MTDNEKPLSRRAAIIDKAMAVDAREYVRRLAKVHAVAATDYLDLGDGFVDRPAYRTLKELGEELTIEDMRAVAGIVGGANRPFMKKYPKELQDATILRVAQRSKRERVSAGAEAPATGD